MNATVSDSELKPEQPLYFLRKQNVFNMEEKENDVEWICMTVCLRQKTPVTEAAEVQSPVQ